MANSKKIICLLLLTGVVASACSTVAAQRRITYEQLARQQGQESIFFDYFTLPGDREGTVQFVTTFRVNYNLLPFKKINNPAGEHKFFSLVGMNIEIFKDDGGQPGKKRKRDFSVNGLEPVDRTFWKDTAYAATYEQTQSKNMFASGKLISELKPGNYSFILQFTRGEEVDGETSQKRMIEILPYHEKNRGNIITVEDFSGSGSTVPEKLTLLNFGSNVYYGKDFYVLVHLPGYKPDEEYLLKVNKVDISERDTTQKNMIYSETIGRQDILSGIHLQAVSGASAINLILSRRDSGGTYALIKIPNSTFQNDVYQLQVNKKGETAPVAQTIFRSRWIEMPTSLLNIDIALNMLQYIVDEATLEKLSDGSDSEKETNFRQFWKERDPTPKTEFNELMAEYYRRIDYAYEQFSTINVSGYNTDQGKIYIQYGPPGNIDRKFPPGEPAVEIWDYGKRQFIFRAVSGFGEFKLVSK